MVDGADDSESELAGDYSTLANRPADPFHPLAYEKPVEPPRNPITSPGAN